MPERRVYAVPGRLIGRPRDRKTYIGYEEVTSGATADHVVPGGRSYAIMPDGELVEETLDIRIALRCGDLSDKAPVAAKSGKKAEA